MNDLIIREVPYHFCKANMQAIVNLVSAAFLGNHKITQVAYDKNTTEVSQKEFRRLLDNSTEDLIEQCQKNGGMFFVAESQEKIIGFSMGSSYEKQGMSQEFVESVIQSPCSFQEVMKGWLDLMGKYAGTPPGKIFHQGPMAVAPKFAKRGIGEQLCAFTAKRILETWYDGFAVETSSESANGLAEKMKRKFSVLDIESNGAGLTFRLHLHQNDKSESIRQWFLEKKGKQALPKEIDVRDISKIGVHYELGNVVVWDSNRDSKQPAVILLHPNSCSRLFFKKQMEDRQLTDTFRLIAIDLPGHGDSKPAADPNTTYTFPGYTQEIVQTVRQLGIADCAILGWSLGGHVAMECLDKISGLRGIVLTGAPPVEVSTAGFGQAFKGIPMEMAKLMGKRHFTREEAALFASGVGKADWMVEYQLKADGRSRERLMEWIVQGVGGDQRTLVAETMLPIALIAGDRDPASPRDYLESLKYGRLWGMRNILDCGHDVIYEKSEEYNRILLEFLRDIF